VVVVVVVVEEHGPLESQSTTWIWDDYMLVSHHKLGEKVRVSTGLGLERIQWRTFRIRESTHPPVRIPGLSHQSATLLSPQHALCLFKNIY